jgi:hypothetical protein
MASMNSSSDSRALMKSGGRHTSKSMLPPPSYPRNDDTFPSNLFAYPLQSATAFPIPNSLPYMLNLGELPIITLYRSKNRAGWTAAKWVLCYLKRSLDHGLTYISGSRQLQAFCDSDWVGCLDDRRSTSGFAIYLGNCLVYWSAKKQPVFSRSSTESEYRAMSITTCELFWLRMLFKELGVPLPVSPVIWCYNISALALASNPVFHARTKHIEVV